MANKPTRCAYCRGLFDPDPLRPNSPMRRTKDHVIPACKGGHVTVACCFQCNADKKDMSIRDWHQLLTHLNDPRAFNVGLFIFKRLEEIENRQAKLARVHPCLEAVMVPVAKCIFKYNGTAAAVNSAMTAKQRQCTIDVASEILDNLGKAGYLSDKAYQPPGV